MKLNQLKTCPFCGVMPEPLIHNEGYYRVKHAATCWIARQDGVHRWSLLDPDEIVDWNRRVEIICDRCHLRQDATTDESEQW